MQSRRVQKRTENRLRCHRISNRLRAKIIKADLMSCHVPLLRWTRVCRFSQPNRAERRSTLDLDNLLQGFTLRSMEPPPDPNVVRLLTIHAAKGFEFENVWIVGVADSILPSWQSLKGRANPAELEEGRRNFFVAITRTRRRLTLTYANQYRGLHRQPSRFINEMNLRDVGIVSKAPVDNIQFAASEDRFG